MSDRTRHKLSIAFSTYNKARADARRRGDEKTLEALNKVLGRMVRDAYKHTRRPVY